MCEAKIGARQAVNLGPDGEHDAASHAYQVQTMTSSMGIMTISRGPCELDNMSLFQDLKLKRRKIDSRCSSDGESAADTSTSSPDPGPPSPRMADPGCNTPPQPPPVFDGGGSPSSSQVCHPTVIRTAPPYSCIKFEGSSTPVKMETFPAPKNEMPSSQSHVKMEVEPLQPPQPYRPRAPAPQPNNPHTALSPIPWSQTCLNGMKPEIIGGHFPPMDGFKSGNRSNTRPTATVLLGETGGIRTMIWSIPELNGEPSSSAPRTPPTPSTPPTPDQATCTEDAARLLLNLGGDMRRPRGPPLNMELLWAGDVSQLPAHQQVHALNLSATAANAAGTSGIAGTSSLALARHELRAMEVEREEDDQPMICMICEDKATGLHYGIITCEGCKGFFKRTVQNRRVYTCVADGGCEITKAQRNRCQYCRFKKCIEQGMVLQAVREDRMPGGRNSGAVYNLYKVKYRKHKKASRPTSASGRRLSPDKTQERKENPLPPIPADIINGTILKTALINPSEVAHLRARIESAVSSTRDRAPIERSLELIQALVDCDATEEIATLRDLPSGFFDTTQIQEKLRMIGDTIVHRMIAWTKKLPFMLELPMHLHSTLLLSKWHEISVLTTAAYQAIHRKPPAICTDYEQSFTLEMTRNLMTLQKCIGTLTGRTITMEQLKVDIGCVVEKITHIVCAFRRLHLRMEEYVCLKVYILVNQEAELEGVQDRYVQALRTYLDHATPNQPNRFNELFARLPEIQAAANMLLESKMFYVPFVLSSGELR